MTTASDDRIRRVAELLAAGWAGRSPAEVASFSRQLSSAAEDAPVASEAVDRAVEIAALSGSVAPRDLAAGTDPERVDGVLDSVLGSFDRTTDAAGHWRWTLRSGARRTALRRIQAENGLDAALAAAVQVPTDAPGRLLRSVASAGPGSIWRADLGDIEPDTLVQALVWALPLGGFGADLAEARRRSQLHALIRSYQPLIQYGVFGRSDALGQLDRFATHQVDPAAALPVLPVLGIGGAGKSTVLAVFLLPRLRAALDGGADGPVCVVLDFDRALLREREQLALSFEVTRQLGCAVPVAAADFSALRYQSRDDILVTGYEGFDSEVANAGERRTVHDFHQAATRMVRRHGLHQRPVVLVLDTYEEVQRVRPASYAPRSEWNDPDQRMLDWIEALRRDMGLTGLRVVVSGRSTIGDATESERLRGQLSDPVRVGDLAGSDAAALLTAGGVPAGVAPRLATIAGGNPLTLRVTARFYTRLGEDEQARFLAEEIQDDLADEVRRAVLYDRFLEHIHESVRPLAHPGLVLRRVTPELVQHVLAPLCGLGQIDQWRARQLTEQLADEVWLVRQAPDGLRHHPEVRRPMLRMMTKETKYSAVILAIHQAAAEWYRSDRETMLSAEFSAMEADYHDLMVSPERELPITDSQRWRRLALHLGDAIGDLPPRIQAQLHLYLDGRLADAQGLQLPAEHWTGWIETRGAELLAADDARAALELLAARSDRQERNDPGWIAQALASTCGWQAYWTPERIHGSRRASPPELDARYSRYAALNAVVSGPEAMAAFIEDTEFELAELKFAPGPALDRLYFDLLCRSDVSAVRPDEWPWRSEAMLALDALSQSMHSGPGAGAQFPVDELRRVVLARFIGATALPRLTALGGLFRPDPIWVESFASAALPAAGKELRALAAELREAGEFRQHTGDALLGMFSAKFARLIGGSGVTLYPSRMEGTAIGLLIGDNPEFRASVRFALEAGRWETYREGDLWELADEVVPVPVRWQEGLGTAQLVEYVDRSGRLLPFLERMADQWPGSMIARVRASFAAWQGAQNSLVFAAD